MTTPWVPTDASFHDDPHEGRRHLSDPYGGPASFEESSCSSCETAVGPFLTEDHNGHPKGDFVAYLAISYTRKPRWVATSTRALLTDTETKVELWCEHCAEPALDVLDMHRNAMG